MSEDVTTQYHLGVSNVRDFEDRINPLNERAVFACAMVALIGAFVGWKLPTASYGPAIALAAGSIAMHLGLSVRSQALNILGGLLATAMAMAVATSERNQDAAGPLIVAFALAVVTAFVARRAEASIDRLDSPLAWTSDLMALSAVVASVVLFFAKPSWLALVPCLCVAVNYCVAAWASGADSVAEIRRRRLPAVLVLLLLLSAAYFAIGTDYFFAYQMALIHSLCLSTLVVYRAEALRKAQNLDP